MRRAAPETNFSQASRSSASNLVAGSAEALLGLYQTAPNALDRIRAIGLSICRHRGPASLFHPLRDPGGLRSLIRFRQAGAALPRLGENRFDDLRELQIGGRVRTEVEYIAQKQVHSHVAAAVEQNRIEIDVADVFRLTAVALHLVVDCLDHVPARALLGRLMNGGVVEKRVRGFLVKNLNKPLGALDDRTGVLTGADVVAAAVVDHDARLIGQDQLSDAIQHVLGDGARDGAVEHRQRGHLIGEVRPELENAAAGKYDAAVLGGGLRL